MQIREATWDDREAIGRLIERGARDVRRRIGPHPPPVSVEDLGARGCMALVAVSEDRIIGSVAYRTRSGRLHLFNLVVDAKHRNKGIARRLILELENVAARSGTKNVTLQTIAELGVGPLFERLGYRVQSAKREFLFTSERERALTTLYMVKRLDKSPSDSTGKWW